MHKIHNSKTYKTFEEMMFTELNRVNGGFSHSVHEACYSETLSKWFARFPREQIHIVDGGILTAEPYEELREIEIFLNIRPYFNRKMFVFDKKRGFYCAIRSNGDKKCMLRSKGRKHLKISNDTHLRLDNYFRGCNKNLRILTGKTFSWMK